MRILSLMAAAVTALSAMPLFAYAKDMPDVGAKAAVVIDAESGELLFAKNETLRLPMASTTKIMSALVVLSQDALDEPFTVDDRAVDTEGSTMGLEKGDKVTLRELCAGMLLPSGNDAANASAYRVSGSIEGFVGLMNEKAEELGLSDTHFVTPSGLDDYTDAHYSTAADMAKLAAIAIKNEDFTAICSKSEMSLPVSGKTLYNTNKLLDSCEGVLPTRQGDAWSRLARERAGPLSASPSMTVTTGLTTRLFLMPASLFTASRPCPLRIRSLMSLLSAQRA